MTRILLVTQYFHPENFKSNDIAFGLAKRGYEVTVLTGLPNYPQGHFYEGYGMFRRRSEIVDGVDIRRTLVFPRGRGGAVRLALNYLSWAVFASVRAFFMSVSEEFDAVIVHETSPVTQGFPALVVKGMRGTPIYFWVLDLWPESLQAVGGVDNRYVIGVFDWIARLMYRCSDRILMSSRGFGKSILAKGPFESKLVYFPNWSEDMATVMSDSRTPCLPEGFRVVFAGNVGEAQDMPSVMKAAELLKGCGVSLVIVGDGRKMDWVREYVAEHSLENVVHLAGIHPPEEMPLFFREADVLFLSLRNDYIFSLTAPAKLQSYMASGKPVIAMTGGETADLIADAGCGFSCAAGDFTAFTDCIIRMKSMSPEERACLGENGRRFYMKNFRKDNCIDHLCAILPER